MGTWEIVKSDFPAKWCPNFRPLTFWRPDTRTMLLKGDYHAKTVLNKETGFSFVSKFTVFFLLFISNTLQSKMQLC